MKRCVFSVVFGVLVSLVTAPAFACGGLFCSVPQGPTPPEPVDQSAERILFEVDEENEKITAHVQIQYAGDPSGFAWIVPVPGVPEVAESSEALFQLLENTTRMQVIPPAPLPCPPPAFSDGGGDDSGFGCSSNDSAGSATSGDGAGGGFAEQPTADSPVTVYGEGNTSNYDYTILGADTVTELVQWLQDNQYNVSENMTPVMEPYNASSMRFLAIKLREGKGNSDIVPLRFTYSSVNPMIPIQLTAVAAQPHMGIAVYITGERVYSPSNYNVIAPRASEILSDGQLRTNYFDWVARTVDEANGRLFVQEFQGFNSLKGEMLTTASGDTFALRGDVMSRYYTRMSGHQMTLDPVFAPVPDDVALNVGVGASTLDLSANTALYECGRLIDENLPSPCAFNYCGAGATCTEIENQAGCICPGDQVAQSLQGPDGNRRVTCVPSRNPVGVTDEAADVGGAFDPCNDLGCGEGQCVVKGGFPTCACDAGAAANLRGDGGVWCTKVDADAATFGPGAGNESAPSMMALKLRARDSHIDELVASLGPLFLLFVLIGVVRRRW